jgi:arylformamidase
MTPLRPRVDWRSLDRASLDKAYNNAAAFANSSAMVAAWEQRSAALRAQHGGVLDLAYGPLPRNRIDFLKSTASAVPTLIFLHGGYWQMRSKDSFTFVASGPLSAGINVALVGYTLAPDATMDQMVAEIRDALDWLTSAPPALNADPSKILLSGWSAGAHYVNDKLGLDEDSARRNSPIRQQSKPSRPLVVVVGGAELPLMYQQSMDYARERIKCGLPVVFDEIPEADHFSILEDMARSDGRLTAIVREAVVAAGISSANR